MDVVSVINYKGGVGKTTLTANLGAELAYRGHAVLLLDLDAQASLTFSLVRPDYWQANLAATGTIKRWYDSFTSGKALPLSDVVITPSRVASNIGSHGQLDLIPSHLGLINVDLELATELGGASLKQSKLNYLRVHRRLADGLADNNLKEYDVVLIDCPPNFNVVTKTAIVASTHVLIPAKADYLSTLGISYLQRSLDELVDDYNDYAKLQTGDGPSPSVDPEILGVVFTMIQFYAQRPIQAQRLYIDETKRLGVPVFESNLRENKTIFADAPQYGVPVVLHGEPRAASLVAEIEELVSEFKVRLEL